ncbi:hypothetical protein SAMN04488048_10313 [Trichococcus flocculiformis]|uniref:hypothetical protein n=1 Tax=Trichococcus TaxID=82802 RepID=UPI0007A88025|nr:MULTISPECIES: hypothetical protein [Trichococcus]CZQ82034.1 Hypothetical protein TES5_178 [Trichococcus sp. ES5]SHF32077.1 hypothetical protein SAMN04488048_10313 [Trichococcus flocculiformis]
MEKQSRIVRFVEQVYRLVIGSLLYWKTILSSGGLCGFVVAADRLMAFLSSGEPTGAEKIESLPYRKLLSFIWCVLFSVVLAGYLLIGKGKGTEMTLFLWIMITTAFVLYHIFLVTLVVLDKENERTLSNGLLYAHTLDHMFRNPTKSLYFLVLSVSALLIGFFNLILFVFLVPSIYWWLLTKGMGQQKKQPKIVAGST